MTRNAALSKRALREYRASLLTILPVLMVILAFRAYPIFEVVRKSFTNWDGLFRMDYVGLGNYAQLFRSDYFWLTMRNCLVLLVNVPIQLFIGMVVAMLLHEKVAGWRFFRSLFYLPQIVSAVIVGYLFKILFSYGGPVNHLVGLLGLEAVDWLGDRGSALFVLITALVWINIGWQGVLFLGGLTAIPDSVLEASELDGANFFQRTFYVIFPMLGRVTEYSCIMSISWTFSGLFSFIFAITKGGPGYDTATIDYLIYQKAFAEGGALGQACAIAVVLLIIISAITLVQKTLSDRMNEWEG
jgi:multiple sugar transport system permease protein